MPSQSPFIRLLLFSAGVEGAYVGAEAISLSVITHNQPDNGSDQRDEHFTCSFSRHFFNCLTNPEPVKINKSSGIFCGVVKQAEAIPHKVRH